jgi:hypothetical protein
VVAAAAAVFVVGGGIWFLSQRGDDSAAEDTEVAIANEVAASDSPAPQPAADQRDDTSAAQGETQADVANDPTAAPNGNSDTEDTGPSAGAAEDGTDKRVVIKVFPHDAMIFLKGKRVGTGDLEVTVREGERQAYEVHAPGYHPRRAIVDGKHRVVRIGLVPVPDDSKSSGAPDQTSPDAAREPKQAAPTTSAATPPKPAAPSATATPRAPKTPPATPEGNNTPAP